MEAAQSSRRSLGEIFVARGLISEADLERALAEQFATRRRLADILVRRGLVTGTDITSALNEQLAEFPGRPESDDQVEVLTHDREDAHESAGVVAAAPMLYPVEGEAWSEADPATASTAPSEDESGHDPQSPGEGETFPADLGGRPTTVEADLTFEPAALIQETDERREAMESRLAALGPILEGLERVQSDLVEHELCSPLLAHELTATQQRLIARSGELSAEITMLKETREEIERTAGLLEELRSELAGKIHELTELRATAAIWTNRVADIEAEVESLTARANKASHDLNVLVDTRVATPAIEAVTETHAPHAIEFMETPVPSEEAAPATRPVDADGHILFVPGEDGYELVEQIGAAPGVGEFIDVDDQRWVVTKIGRSPLPFDDRDCAFLTASA